MIIEIEVELTSQTQIFNCCVGAWYIFVKKFK